MMMSDVSRMYCEARSVVYVLIEDEAPVAEH